MGLCEANAKNLYESNSNQNIDNYQIETNKKENETHKLSIIQKTIKKEELPLEEERFKDMPIWEGIIKYNKIGEIYDGYGIKRMHAYKCDLNINDLNKLRDDFWNSRKTHHTHWKILHHGILNIYINLACVYDHEKAEEYLAKHLFKVINGCLNICEDENGILYKIPNFCINLPHFEKELLNDDKFNDNNIKIILTDVKNCIKNEVEVKLSTKGQEIIKTYSNNNNIDLNKYKVRLLFGGGIIKENESLYQHKIKNGYNIQITVAPII